MKKILSFLLVIIMLFTLSINVFAWSGSEWWDNLASEEIRTNAPQSATPSHHKNIMLWNIEEQSYYKFENTGTAGNNAYYINSKTGIVYQTGNQKTFEIFKYENSVWNQISLDDGTKVFETYDISDYLLVSNTARVFIDDTSYVFSPESGELIVNGEVIEKPSEDDSITDEDDNSGILSGIKDMFSPIFDLIDFIKELINKFVEFFKNLYETIKRIPDFVKELDNLFSPDGDILASFKILFYFEDNPYSTAIFSLVCLFLAYTIFCLASWVIKKITFKE